MKFAIQAVFLSATSTKPSRVKFSNGNNTITKEICVSGDTWNKAESATDGKTHNIVKQLACDYARNRLHCHYGSFEIAMLKEYPRSEYVIVPIGEKKQ